MSVFAVILSVINELHLIHQETVKFTTASAKARTCANRAPLIESYEKEVTRRNVSCDWLIGFLFLLQPFRNH